MKIGLMEKPQHIAVLEKWNCIWLHHHPHCGARGYLVTVLGPAGGVPALGLVDLLVLGQLGEDYHLCSPPWQYLDFLQQSWPRAGLVCTVEVGLLPLKRLVCGLHVEWLWLMGVTFYALKAMFLLVCKVKPYLFNALMLIFTHKWTSILTLMVFQLHHALGDLIQIFCKLRKCLFPCWCSQHGLGSDKQIKI